MSTIKILTIDNDTATQLVDWLQLLADDNYGYAIETNLMEIADAINCFDTVVIQIKDEPID